MLSTAFGYCSSGKIWNELKKACKLMNRNLLSSGC